jgi:hypothetical protein
MSTLMLFSIQPGSEKVKADTAQSFIITPIVKDQRLNTERADLKIIARIRELGTYPYGWDGVDGKAPSEEAVDEAEKFAWSFLRDEGIEKPIISLAADGEIAFLWTLPDFRLDLGFYGDSTYSYYGRTSGGREFMSDGESIDAPLPEEIMKLIQNKNPTNAIFQGR